MDAQEHHEMQLAVTHPSGAEEWHCPTCGRRFLLNWPPAYQKIVLEPGDEYAAHSGSKGGMLRMGPVELVGADELPLGSEQRYMADDVLLPEASQTGDELGDVPITDELQPWLRWLNEARLDDRSGEAD